MVSKEQVPDCPHDCPLEDPHLDEEDDGYRAMAEEECGECWWHGEEAQELQTHCELFDFCLEWLRKKEIDLAEPRELLTYREEQAIFLVHTRLEAARARQMKNPPKRDD